METGFVLREVETEFCSACNSNIDECLSSEGSINILFPLVAYIFYIILFVRPFSISLIFSYLNGDSFSARTVIEIYLLIYLLAPT